MEFLNLIISFLGEHPYLVVLVGFTFILFFFPLTEEAVLFIGGYLSSLNQNYVWLPTLIAGIVGVFITDYWTYFLAKKFGCKLLEKPFLRKVFSEEKQNKASRFVQKYGMWSIFIIRFVPGGLRNPVFFISGLFGFSKIKFIFTALSGAIISVQISFWLGYLLHDSLPPLEIMLKEFKKYSQILVLVIILVLLVFYFVYKLRKKNK